MSGHEYNGHQYSGFGHLRLHVEATAALKPDIQNHAAGHACRGVHQHFTRMGKFFHAITDRPKKAAESPTDYVIVIYNQDDRILDQFARYGNLRGHIGHHASSSSCIARLKIPLIGLLGVAPLPDTTCRARIH
ncbi:hypothetical protein D3C86_1560230 [compost metagenome]